LKRNAAIIATGQTKHQSKRNDANQAEMVFEAARRALEDAQLEMKDIDAVITDNMELFEGRALPDMWVAEGAGAYMKHQLKIATGGTSGSSAVIAGYYTAASGLFDLVMVVGFEKHSDGHTFAGMTLTNPFWDRPIASAAPGNFALSITEYMASRGVTQEQAAMVAVKARKNALNNPYAHLHIPDITVEKVLNSRMIAYPIHLLDMCPQSDGACAIIYASEKKAKELCENPAWVKAAVTRHDTPYLGDHIDRLATIRTIRECSRIIYKKLGITDPVKQFDVAEIYEPVSYAELAWYEAMGFCEEGEAGKLIEDGVTSMDGELPVNPSGGVLSTNPVGASGVIRAAEGALQIHGKAGKRQVPDVETVLVHGYGVYTWCDMMVLSSHL